MTKIAQVIILFLAVGPFPIGVKAVPQDNQDNALKPYWNVHSDGIDVGGCDAHEENLRTAWEEACKFSRQALSDVQFMEQNHNNGDGPNAQQQPNERKRWDRVYPTLLALFGSPFDSQKNLLTGDRAVFDKVRRFFAEMQLKCSVREPFGAKPYLYCDDKQFRFIRDEEPDPEDPDSKIEENYPTCKKYGGIWYSDQNPDFEHYVQRAPPLDDEDRIYCRGETRAMTRMEPPKIMWWCPAGLKDTPSIDAVRSRIRMVRTPPALATMLIRTHRITKLDNIAGDFDINDMPTTWIHEMGHLLFRQRDHQTYDSNGNLKTLRQDVWDSNTRRFVESQKPAETFNFKEATRLAKFNPRAAIESPENFAQFAKAMYLSDWDWHLGYAQPPP
ncbi:hypothetical protein K458DRAFT_388163 [Lentithecium fluviatile CBS 122367]|uniref:Zincin n=1 Tax=Lentithecium fluviatile CBS 122367 TaxID=1168545 RepID=A0A6G1J428_9PLEO|nr:hypothetical protein K458DRAFT_388163 [Lentithecium fluviatile CBS 122367]